MYAEGRAFKDGRTTDAASIAFFAELAPTREAGPPVARVEEVRWDESARALAVPMNVSRYSSRSWLSRIRCTTVFQSVLGIL